MARVVKVTSWKQLDELPVGTPVYDPVSGLNGQTRHGSLGTYLPLADDLLTRVVLYPRYEGGEFGEPMLATLPA